MKNGKRLFLLFLSLCLTLSLFACGKGDEEEGSESAALSDQDSGETEDPSAEEVPETGDPSRDMFRYFVLENRTDSIDFSKVTQYEGEVVAVDEKNHLMAIRTRDLDMTNTVTDRISVYGILTGELIREETVTNPLGAERPTELSVELDYPILRVIRRTEGEDGVFTYEVSHYFAKKGSELIHTAQRYVPAEQMPKTVYGNGLVSYNMGDTVIWIDRNMEILRTADAVADAGYEVNEFRSEYQGYLYAWDARTLQIFNRLGICSGTYTIAHEGELNVHVLDNGNVLIQDLEKVDAHTSADLILENTRYRLTSLIMNYLDGTTREVKLDFLVDTLETAYSERYGDTGGKMLPFRLAEGYDNQAILYRFANGRVSVYQEYAVLGNDLQVLYTVENRTEGVLLKEARPVNGETYLAPVAEGGFFHLYLFDAEGRAITPVGAAEITNRYLVTEWGIYDHRMELIYDLSEGSFAGSLFGTDTANDRIYLKKYNFYTGAEETYVFNGETEEPVLLCDGAGTDLSLVGEGYYVLHDRATDQYLFCHKDGEVKLIVHGSYEFLRAEDALLIGTEFEGTDMVFVIR